jgi:hypothetical protein
MARTLLDTTYDHLYKLYMSNYDKYLEEAKAVKDKIKSSPGAVNDYKSAYPDIEDPDFNEHLYRKKEFNRNKSGPEYTGKDYASLANDKCSQVDFKLTSNQKFIKNFISPFTPYNGLLLFHGVGVGKTCTAISIAEQYLHDQVNPKKVLVILSGNIKDNFKKQIFDITKYDVTTNRSMLCTGTKYPDMILDKEIISRDLFEKRVNKLINDRYQFVGYKELVFVTQKIMTRVEKTEKNPAKHKQRYEEKIKELFSNRLIIVDEAHNLRMQSEAGKKQISNTLFEILKLANNSKLVLLSATPMFNTAREIVWMVNLLLTNDKRQNIKVSDIFDAAGKLTAEGRKRLVTATRGYVSYMRGENPFSFPFRLYPSSNNDKSIITKFPSKDMQGKHILKNKLIKYLELVGSKMSPAQIRAYDALKKNIVFTDDSDDDEDEDETISNDLQTAIQLSNIVYPTLGKDVKPTGEVGFKNCFEKLDKKGIRYKDSTLKMHGEILSYPLIEQYSPKIKKILDYIINSKGIVFLYSQYYYSGIYPLILALEHIGFRKYNSKNIGSNITIDSKFDAKKPPSYIVISRDKEISPNNDQEIAAAKSPSNLRGENIKVIIVSKVGTEGIDFKRIREVHLLEPWFNLNRAEQIIGRAVRTCSHIDLPVEERNTTVYLHASIYNEDEESIDIKTYRVAENKQVNITDVQRLLKDTAVDCNLNHGALIFDSAKVDMKIDIKTSQGKAIKGYQVGDRDFSYICDFKKCELNCTPALSAKEGIEIDDSTFNTFFVTDDIDMYIKYIESAYATQKQYAYEELMDVLTIMYSTIENEILAYALQQMLDERVKIRDGDGTPGFIMYRGNMYIFQPLSSYEMRLSLEERTSSLKKNRLDFEALESHVAKTKPPSARDTDKSPASRSPQSRHTDVLTTVIDRITERKNDINLGSVLPDNIYVDAVVDRLSGDEILHVIQELSKPAVQHAPSTLRIFESMKQAGLFVGATKAPSDIKGFYFYVDETMYVTKNGLPPKKAGPLEISSMHTDISRLEKQIADYNTKDTHKGTIFFNPKKGECIFKVKDNPKTKGYVCTQASSLLPTSDLKDRIEALKPGILGDRKLKKDKLCEIYEYLLRQQGPEIFKRPYLQKN